MLTVNKYKNILLDHFYLDTDDITIRRKKDGWRNKYKQHDVVVPFKLCKYGYGGIHIPGTRSTVSYAHLVTLLRGIEIPDNCVLDHIDGVDTNNARENIRIVSQQLNCRNRSMHSNNTTGYTGISWNSKAKCYIVRRCIKGIRVYGGSAKTLEKAIELLASLEKLALEDGYTSRHGKQSATTIPKGSTLQAIGSGSAQSLSSIH